MEKDKKRFHYWAAVGHDFKSELVFYEVKDKIGKESKNGKMSHDCYVDSILDPVVKPWLKYGGWQDFVLEEDGDSGHRKPGKSIKSQNNRMAVWKRKHRLETYQNFPHSPDLSPIENCWLIPKENLRKMPH